MQQAGCHHANFSPSQLCSDMQISHPSILVLVIIRLKINTYGISTILHTACFSLVKSTWKKAIEQQNFNTWPGLTATLVKRHCPPSIATMQGHLHQERQHLQSTKKVVSPKIISTQLKRNYQC